MMVATMQTRVWRVWGSLIGKGGKLHPAMPSPGVYLLPPTMVVVANHPTPL